jgi:hypothetical protein
MVTGSGAASGVGSGASAEARTSPLSVPIADVIDGARVRGTRLIAVLRSQLQGLLDATQTSVSSVKEGTASRAKSAAVAATDAAMHTVVAVDKRLGVRDLAESVDARLGISTKVVTAATTLEEKYSLTARYASALQRVRGACGCERLRWCGELTGGWWCCCCWLLGVRLCSCNRLTSA